MQIGKLGEEVFFKAVIEDLRVIQPERKAVILIFWSHVLWQAGHILWLLSCLCSTKRPLADPDL